MDHGAKRHDVEVTPREDVELAHVRLIQRSISMITACAMDALPTIRDRVMGVNYGFDRLRLVSPVKSGSKIRGRFVLKSLVSKSDTQHQLVHTVTIEIEGAEKPALVADWVTLVHTK
jgi:acyl dehydratase